MVNAPETSISALIAKTTKYLLRAPAFLLQASVTVVVAPYRYFYHENTRDPILRILQSEDQTVVRDEVRRWIDRKRNEAQYVQAAVSLARPSQLPIRSSVNVFLLFLIFSLFLPRISCRAVVEAFISHFLVESMTAQHRKKY